MSTSVTIMNFTVYNIAFDGNQGQETDVNSKALVDLKSSANYNLNIYFDIFRSCRNYACLEINGESMNIWNNQFLNSGVSGGSFLPYGIIFNLGVAQVWAYGNFFNDLQGGAIETYKCFYCTFGNNGFDDNALSGTGADYNSLAQTEWTSIVDNSFSHTAAGGVSNPFINIQVGAYNTVTGNTFDSKSSNQGVANILGGTQSVWSSNSMVDFGASASMVFLQVHSSCLVCTVSNNGMTVNSASATDLEISGAAGLIISANAFSCGSPTCKGILFDGVAANSPTITSNTFRSITTPITYTTIPSGTTVIRNNAGLNPIGSPPNCLDVKNNIAPWGTTGTCVFTLTSGTTYTVNGADAQISFMNFGTGTGNISLNTNIGAGPFTIPCASTVPTIDLLFFPIGSTVQSYCSLTQPQIDIGFQ
jgi:hypothetical protein